MSKALIKCLNCEYEWEYSGLSCESAYCPVCSKEIVFSEPGTAVKIIDHFGFASAQQGSVRSYNSVDSGRDKSDEDYPDKELDDALVDDLGL